MAVRWWVLTDNRLSRYLLGQMSPFGVYFSNVIFYRIRADRLLEQARQSSSGLVLQVMGPDDHAAAATIAGESNQPIGTCRGANIVFALQGGVSVGHVCWRSGTFRLAELEREETFDDGVYLFSLYTSPSVRRQGVAKLLITSAVEQAMGESGQSYVYMYIRTENLASRRLVESLGFEAVKATHYLRVFRLTSYQSEAPPLPLSSQPTP